MHGSVKSKLPNWFSSPDSLGSSFTSVMVGVGFSMTGNISKWDSDFLMTSCLDDLLPLIYVIPDSYTKFSL